MAEGFARTDKEIKELHASIVELREAGKETDARLTILIDIVDRLIRRNGKQ